MRNVILILTLLMNSVVYGQQATRGMGKLVKDPVPSATVKCLEVPLAIRNQYPNPDGACVFLSMAVSGVHSNDQKCSRLPFNSAMGPQVRGGADPQRVARVCAQRGIHAYNVTGAASIPMARWAVKTGRGCAIGFDSEHFQAVWGYDYERQVWFIWDNRYPDQLREYTEAEFERMHDLSGRWVVVLEKPGERIPRPTEW